MTMRSIIISFTVCFILTLETADKTQLNSTNTPSIASEALAVRGLSRRVRKHREGHPITYAGLTHLCNAFYKPLLGPEESYLPEQTREVFELLKIYQLIQRSFRGPL